MRRLGLSVSAFALVVYFGGFALAAPMRAEAPVWTIDPDHSSVSFSIRHIFSQVSGTFDRVEGTVRFDTADLAGSRIDVTIPIAAVNTRNDQRDSHLKTPDFFDAARWLAMHFVSDRIESLGGNRYLARGRLTIRDVSRPLDLEFTVLGTTDHPMRAEYLVTGVRAGTTLRRTEFGVGTGTWAETALIGDEVAVRIEIEANRPRVASGGTAPASASRPSATSRPASAPASRPAR